ncbi:MAG: AAA family ATPase [Anaerolineales bacterium]|nr:AAA family ATPase [Anaerolineales bacterium]
MARLLITLLGAFEVDLDGQPVTAFEYDKVRALLAYLAVEADRPHRREMLAELLWPRRSERSARQNLSQALFKLRHLLDSLQTAPPFLLVTPQTLQFNPASDYQLDVTTFTNLLAAGQSHAHDRLETCGMCRAQLRQAVALYRGDFLKGFSLGDSPAFEEWSVLTREQLHRLAGEALGRLVSFLEGEGTYGEALTYVWRQVELEPWREDNRRTLMRLLALSGQRRAALAQYDTCCRLAEEIGIEPEVETTALCEQIRAGKLSGVAERKTKEGSGLKPQESKSSRKPAVTDYPLPPAPFVGRETQLACLDSFLNTALTGRGRIVLVTGGPGQGKTALIQELIRRAQATQPHLIVVGGKGNAHTGSGDPYLPFREVLALLTGDIEAQWAAGAVSQEDADRLWRLLPHSIQALLEVGPDLIGSFLPGEALIKRAEVFRSDLDRSIWIHLNQLVERLTDPGDSATRPQSDLFEQYSRVLRWLAQHRPLLLVLDDLQWIDHASANLLFHLGQRIEASRILIVGALSSG